MMQTAIPCLMFAPDSSQLRLLGGTNAEFAPEIDYYSMVSLSCSRESRRLFCGKNRFFNRLQDVLISILI